MQRTERGVLIVTVLSVLLAGCGSTSARRGRVVYPALSEADALIFDNGADFIEDPESLDGQWRDDWTDEFRLRSEKADLIATVTLTDVQSEVDEVQGTEVHRFTASVIDVLYGDRRGREFALRTAPSDRGYSTVSNTDAVAARAWVAFIKWRTGDDGSRLAAWHLAPAADPIARRLGFLIERRQDSEGTSGRRIIVHTTTN